MSPYAAILLAVIVVAQIRVNLAQKALLRELRERQQTQAENIASAVRNLERVAQNNAGLVKLVESLVDMHTTQIAWNQKHDELVATQRAVNAGVQATIEGLATAWAARRV